MYMIWLVKNINHNLCDLKNQFSRYLHKKKFTGLNLTNQDLFKKQI